MTDYLIYFKDGTAYYDIFKDVRSARKCAVKLIKSGMNVHRISRITAHGSHRVPQYINSTRTSHGGWEITIDVLNPQKMEFCTHILYADGTISKNSW